MSIIVGYKCHFWFTNRYIYIYSFHMFFWTYIKTKKGQSLPVTYYGFCPRGLLTCIGWDDNCNVHHATTGGDEWYHVARDTMSYASTIGHWQAVPGHSWCLHDKLGIRKHTLNHLLYILTGLWYRCCHVPIWLVAWAPLLTIRAFRICSVLV